MSREAKQLVGKIVRFTNDPPDNSPLYLVVAEKDGMVELELNDTPVVGRFDPDLFTVEGPF